MEGWRLEFEKWNLRARECECVVWKGGRTMLRENGVGRNREPKGERIEMRNRDITTPSQCRSNSPVQVISIIGMVRR